MIQFTVIKKGSAQYLVYDLQGANREIDDISVMMINSNQKKNGALAKISFDELNGEKQRILFEITGMVKLSDYLQRNQIPESCCNLILSIVSAIDGLSEYMIDADSVLLNPDFVFVNPITKQVTFICPPFTNKDDLPMSDLSTFFRTICTLAFSNPMLRPNDTGILQTVSNIAANPATFSLDTLRKLLKPEQTQTPAAGSAAPEAAAPNQAAGVSGDVAFEPSVTFQENESPTKPAKGLKAVKIAKNTKNAPEAPVTPVPMPGSEKKEKKSLLDKFKKKKSGDNKKPAKEETGGLASLAKAKKQQPAAPVPAPAPIPAPIPAPMPTPAPMSAPMPAPVLPFAPPAPTQVPASASVTPNHTILIPAGSAIQPLSAEGLAAMSARMDQAQQNLFSAPNALAIPQAPNANDVLSGGMSGLQSVGLTAPEAPVPAPAPAPEQTPEQTPAPAAEAPEQNDDPKTIVMFPDDDKTVLLQKASLIRKRDGSVYKIEQPLVRIGRNRPDIEINLRGNNHIGHLHASILLANGVYSITDHQSVNHTYLNHQQLEPEKQYPLQHGDLIVCADEEFEFQSEN